MPISRPRTWLAAFLLALPAVAHAQPAPDNRFLDPELTQPVPGDAILPGALADVVAQRPDGVVDGGGIVIPPDESPYPNVVVTGYWPPTNEMVRRFSATPELNPDGWIGANWEDRGYDVYAFFPQFTPPGCTSCGQGYGDLEVDYQDTTADYWPIVNTLEPVAVITFSRGANNLSWEVEMNQYNRSSWVNDYTPPLQPTPVPPDADYPTNGKRLSKLPVEEIVAAVDAAGLGLDPFICYSGSGGGFLSEFMAYHGVWYQALHDNPTDEDFCVAAGHVHVGGQITWPTATEAAYVTIRTVLDHVDGYVVGDIDGDGLVGVSDLLAVLSAWGPCPATPPCPEDVDGNDEIGVGDLLLILSNWS